MPFGCQAIHFVPPARRLSRVEIRRGQQCFRRALAGCNQASIGLHHRGFATPLLGVRIGRDDGGRCSVPRHLSPSFENGRVHRVARFVSRRQSGGFEQRHVGHTVSGDEVLQPQAAFGEGTGLIGADAADPAHVFHRHAAAHQGFPPRQAIHPDAEKNRKNDRKFLRQRRDGQRCRTDQGIHPIEALAESHPGQYQAKHAGDDHQQRHQMSDGTLQRRSLSGPADLGGAHDLPVQGFSSGVHHTEVGISGQQPSTRQPPMRIADPHGMRGCVARSRKISGSALRDGISFSGQRRFIGLEILTRHQYTVSREGLAGGNPNEVAGDQLTGRELEQRTVPDRPGGFRQLTAEARRRRLSPTMQKGIHTDQGHDRDQQAGRFRGAAQRRVDQSDPDQKPDHWILCRVASQTEPRTLNHFEDLVLSVGPSPRQDSLLGQTLLPRGYVGPTGMGNLSTHRQIGKTRATGSAWKVRSL